MVATTFVEKIIAIAVMIIVIATVTIPVVNDTQDSLVFKAQNTAQLYTAVAASDDVNIEITLAGGTLTVDGFDASAGLSGFNIIAVCDSFCLCTQNSTSSFRVMVPGESYSYKGIFSATIANGELSFTKDEVDYTVPIVGQLLYAAESGTYGNFDVGPIYVNTNSTIYTMVSGTVSSPGQSNKNLTAIFKGTYDDLDCMTGNLAGDFGDDITVTGALADPVLSGNGYKEIGASNGISMAYSATINASGIEYTGTLQAPVLAPVEYTYTTSGGESQISLFNIIPLLLIIATMLVAVGLLRGKS